MKLKKGEVRCDKCDGEPYLFIKGEHEDICSKCNGNGKLDWIENAIGKEPIIIDKNETIIALNFPPPNPKKNEYYFDLTIKKAMIFRNNGWESFDYYRTKYAAKTR